MSKSKRDAETLRMAIIRRAAELGINRNRLAKEANVTRSKLYAWFAGEHDLLSESVDALMQVLGMRVA